MQKWEYDYLQRTTNDAGDVEKFIEDLNRFGEEGWEVTGFAQKLLGKSSQVFDTSDEVCTCLLKRPKR